MNDGYNINNVISVQKHILALSIANKVRFIYIY